MLRNLEASAAGTPPPPRFMAMYWPVGTVRYFFLPTAPAVDISGSRILKPIADAGLQEDTIALYGLQVSSIRSQNGGGPEAGTVKVMTGAESPGTRVNGGEGDDAVAGGPSFDQIFLKHVPDLQRPGDGYCNVLCDARVDSFETSAQNLSYSHLTRPVMSVTGSIITENTPLAPFLRPANTYAQLFGTFSGMPLDSQRAVNLLRARRSVLDHSLRQLARLRTLAPASESVRIDQHADIVRKLEAQLSDQIVAGACEVPAGPDPALAAPSGSHNDYRLNPTPAPADDVMHAMIGQAHAAVLRAAFQCDLIRVATFQWAPGTSHVAFQGLFPPDPTGAYMHNPTSHVITDTREVLNSYPTTPLHQGVVDFLANVHAWYNQQTAQILLGFKQATDVYGGNLLDRTIVPFVTDVACCTSAWSPMPALIFGGRKLGMVGGQFLDLSARVRPMNDLWMTIAQAYLKTTDPLPAFADEVFVKTNVSPISGVWQQP